MSGDGRLLCNQSNCLGSGSKSKKSAVSGTDSTSPFPLADLSIHSAFSKEDINFIQENAVQGTPLWEFLHHGRFTSSTIGNLEKLGGQLVQDYSSESLSLSLTSVKEGFDYVGKAKDLCQSIRLLDEQESHEAGKVTTRNQLKLRGILLKAFGIEESICRTRNPTCDAPTVDADGANKNNDDVITIVGESFRSDKHNVAVTPFFKRARESYCNEAMKNGKVAELLILQRDDVREILLDCAEMIHNDAADVDPMKVGSVDKNKWSIEVDCGLHIVPEKQMLASSPDGVLYCGVIGSTKVRSPADIYVYIIYIHI